MPTSYPGAFDALTNPITTDPLTAPSHAGQHADANDAIEALQVRAGRTGTSFPGSPATGARFRRTDRNIEYFYDGTRWLSEQLFVLSLAGGGDNANFAAASIAIARVPLWAADAWDVYVTDVVFLSRVDTTNSGTAYWTLNLEKGPPTGALTSIASRSTGTGPDTAGTFYTEKVAVNAVVAQSTHNFLYFHAVKISTPGGLIANAYVKYRLVG